MNIGLFTYLLFVSFISRQYLNVSLNHLSNIEHDAFKELNSLQILDLSNNNLKDLSLQLPDNIEHISIAFNKLVFWPIVQIPTNLRKLELQSNQIIEIMNTIGKNRIEVPSLSILNVSHNQIESFPTAIHYSALKILDASYNEFKNVPLYLGSQAPEIEIFHFRGNPIERIEFAAKISAHTLDFSDSHSLNAFDAEQFNSICK